MSAVVETISTTVVEEIPDYETLIQTVKENPRVIVDFYAPWCKPCKRIMPEYEKMAGDFSEVKFVKVNIEELDDEELEHLNIAKFPTFVFTKSRLTDGKIEKMRYQGSVAEELREQITSYLGVC